MDTFMNLAIDEAKIGKQQGGIPIGSILVKEGKIIGKGYNKRVQENDPVMHAVIDCLRNAGRIGNYEGVSIYSTLMPCYLCAGAIIQFGIKKLVVGESENFSGAKEFMERHGIEIINMDVEECKLLMGNFIEKCNSLWTEDIGEMK